MSTTPGSATQGLQPLATLTKDWPPNLQTNELKIVQFAYNPEKITFGHSHQTTMTSGASAEDQIKALGFVEIGVSKIVFTGRDLKKVCDTLIIWSYPVTQTGDPLAGSDIGGGNQQQAKKKTPSYPVNLTFTWGNQQFSWGVQQNFPVYLRKVDVTYTRFAPDGTPIRAEVNLGLYQDRAKALRPTNPTSGGPSGRRTRMLDSSDRLPALAAANYGRPGAWRQIARANGVDDPLRMKPGTMLFLPEQDELAAGTIVPGADR
ncbi:MAG TPA: hypothetical protein VGM10_00595 [Actinocrinis sp.]|jgi:hypothetical protein